MFSFFRCRQTERKVPVVTEKAANAVRVALFKAKSAFALTLSRYERRLTIWQKKMALVGFCLAMSCLSAYWLYEGIFSKGKDRPSYLKQKTITPPPAITLPDSLNTELLKARKAKWEAQRTTTDSKKIKP